MLTPLRHPHLRRRAALGLAVSLSSLLGGCLSQRCYDERDCPLPKLCSPTGACVLECDGEHACGAGLLCVANRCQAATLPTISCPADMVGVAGSFCADKYEASRPDATPTSSGRDESRALSVAGVLPWPVLDNATAAAACAASGKRLCAAAEWRVACKGSDGTTYAYGNTYEPATCNGIDAFPQGFHLAPTGSFPGCTNGWGVVDINGNLWEHVAGGDDFTVRGGAFNCGDSAAFHKCDYVPGNWTPSARGFRCCLTPGQGVVDAGGARDAAVADVSDASPVDQPGSGEGGCVDDLDGAVDTAVSVVDAPIADAPMGSDLAASEDGGDGMDSAVDGGAVTCPSEMARVGTVCIDRWEASRADATATGGGSDERIATSRAGVLPWYVRPMSKTALDRFEGACAAAGKRLCRASEWLDACAGPTASRYFFGDTWDASACNSVDTHCGTCCAALGLASCPSGENCGYASELTSSYTPETCSLTAPYGRESCHVCYHVMPTGSFPRCTNPTGLFDVNGNVWEVVPAPDPDDSRGYQVRGGAFNCGTPSARFACTFEAGWDDLYAGFRCCKD